MAVESVDPYAEFTLPSYETRDSTHNTDHMSQASRLSRARWQLV